MEFTQAIVRIPSPELVHGLSKVDLGEPDYKTAMIQHAAYLKVFYELGIEIGMLAADNYYPDSCFIEDVAVCTSKFAVVTRPGAPSRRGEIKGMEEVLAEFFEQIETIKAPGTLEGGDVMMVENHFFIGLSERTNEEGAQQFIELLEKHGLTGSTVVLSDGLHLKTGMSYLENNKLLALKDYVQDPQFARFDLIEVDQEEAYAANSLWVNGTVIVPEGFPRTQKKIEQAGFVTVTVPMREFQKVDGGLSCLSLRF